MIDVEKSMFALSGLCAAGLLALHLAAGGGHVATASVAGGGGEGGRVAAPARPAALPATGRTGGRAAGCVALRWPNIPPECLSGDDGMFVREPVRTVTTEFRTADAGALLPHGPVAR